MVNLKISLRSIGDELQYRRDGSFKQLEMIVVLKSEVGCKLARSSTTDAETKHKKVITKRTSDAQVLGLEAIPT